MSEIEYLSSHPWLSRGLKKLKKPELVILQDFISRRFDSKDLAMEACNRIFLDKPKPKNFTTILELASACIVYRYGAQ